MSEPKEPTEQSDSLRCYVATGRGWELDSVDFMKQVCVDVGSHPSRESTTSLKVMQPCRWEDDPIAQETTFHVGDRQLGGWRWDDLRHAIENGYSQKFCETMVRQLKQELSS